MLDNFEHRLRANEAWEPDGNRRVVCSMHYGFVELHDDKVVIIDGDKLFFDQPEYRRNGDLLRLASKDAVKRHLSKTYPGRSFRIIEASKRLSAPSGIPSEAFSVPVWGFIFD